MATPLTALLMLAACTTSSADDSDKQSDAGTGQTDQGNKLATLVFFNGSEAQKYIATGSLPALGDTGPTPERLNKDPKLAASVQPDPAAKKLAQLDLTNNILGRCGYVPPKTANHFAAFLAPIASWAISEVTTWVVGAIDKRLEAEVKKYTVAKTAGPAELNLYGKLSGGSALTKDAALCFRASIRGKSDPKNPKSSPTLLADFVGRIEFKKDQPEILKLEPVRLFYQRIDTPSSDGNVAVNVKFSADVISKNQQTAVLQKAAIDTALASAKIDKTKLNAASPYYKVFPEAEKTAHVIPLPAWDYVAHSSTPANNYIRGTVTFTEIGNVPWLLKNLCSLLDSNKDGVAKSLATELDSELGLSSSSGSTPDAKSGTSATPAKSSSTASDTSSTKASPCTPTDTTADTAKAN